VVALPQSASYRAPRPPWLAAVAGRRWLSRGGVVTASLAQAGGRFHQRRSRPPCFMAASHTGAARPRTPRQGSPPGRRQVIFQRVNGVVSDPLRRWSLERLWSGGGDVSGRRSRQGVSTLGAAVGLVVAPLSLAGLAPLWFRLAAVSGCRALRAAEEAEGFAVRWNGQQARTSAELQRTPPGRSWSKCGRIQSGMRLTRPRFRR